MAPGDGEQLSEAELRRKSAAGTLTDAEAAQLNRLKGKGAAPQAEPEGVDDEDDEDEEDEEADDEEDADGDDDDDDDEEEEEDEEEEKEKRADNGKKGDSNSEVKEPPKKKHKASSSKAGPSKGGGNEGDSDVEILDGLSGDEVDASNIIQGGRRTRRGRATSAPKYSKQAAGDNSDDEW